MPRLQCKSDHGNCDLENLKIKKKKIEIRV